MRYHQPFTTKQTTMLQMKTRIATLTSVGLLALAFSFAVSVFWASPYILTLVALPFPFFLSLLFRNKKRVLRLALVGMIVGPIVEIACVFGGLWTYSDTGELPAIPLWILPGWTCFPLSLVVIAETVTKRPFRTPRSILTPYWLIGAILLQTVLFVSLGNQTITALVAAAVLTFGVALFMLRKETLVLLIVGGILGPLVESLPILAGAWSYRTSEILGMPVYMPWAYGLFAVFVVTLAAYVADASRSSKPDTNDLKVR